MMSGQGRFNIYLLCVIAAAVVCGCHTTKDPEKEKQKRLATFRVHLEATADDTSPSLKVPIYRAKPVEVPVDRDAFITEAHVANARVMDTLGGFELQIQLGRQGTWLLQEYSASNTGKHFAIFSQFGEKGKQARWLAAPQFSRVISDGIIQFTPDASREECEEIVIGLNNIAKKNAENLKW
jgi:hypothetical protein